MERVISVLDYILIAFGITVLIFFIIEDETLLDGIFVLATMVFLKLSKARNHRFITLLAYSGSSIMLIGLFLSSLNHDKLIEYGFIIAIPIAFFFAIIARYSTYLLTFLWSGFFLLTFYTNIIIKGWGEVFSHLWSEDVLYYTYEQYFSIFILIIICGIVYESYRKQQFRFI